MAGSHGLLALREALAAVEAIPSAKNQVWHGGEALRAIRRFARALVDTGGGDELQRRAALAGTPSGDVSEADGCTWLLAAHMADEPEGAVDSGDLPSDDVFRVEWLRTSKGRLYVERIKAAARALVAWVETAESSHVGPGDFLDAAERFRRIRAETTARGDHALGLAVEHAARLVKRASDQGLIDLPAGIPWPPATTSLADQTGQWKLCWASVVKLIQVALPHETGSNPAALRVTRLPTDGADSLTLGCEKAEDWQPRAENYAELCRVLAERVADHRPGKTATPPKPADNVPRRRKRRKRGGQEQYSSADDDRTEKRFRASGMTVAEYAEREGIGPDDLQKLLDRCRYRRRVQAGELRRKG